MFQKHGRINKCFAKHLQRMRGTKIEVYKNIFIFSVIYHITVARQITLASSFHTVM